MPENFISSVRFVAQANENGFVPEQSATFSAALTAPSAILRARIEASQNDEKIEIILVINDANDHFLNYSRFEVHANEDATASMSDISRFEVNQSYTLHILGISGNFSPNEEIGITINIIELETNISEVTRNVLAEAENDATTNAVAFGFSEASIASTFSDYRQGLELNLGRTSSLRLSIDIASYRYSANKFPSSPQARIDTEKGNITITATLEVEIKTNERLRVASGLVAVEVICRPAMTTSTSDFFQLQFISASILPNLSLFLDVMNLEAILQEYPDVNAFRSEIDEIVSSIIFMHGQYTTFLPAFIESRPMPNLWDRAINMELTFLKFSYQKIITHGVDVGYVYAVFTVRSLNLPIPCYCDSATSSKLQTAELPVEIDSGADVAERERFSARISLDRSIIGSRETPEAINRIDIEMPENPWIPPAYFHIGPAAELMAFGVSQRAYREIAKTYLNLGDDMSYTSDGTFYVMARFWYRTTLEAAVITSDGVRSIIDFTGEGMAKAAVRDPCGHDIAPAGVRLRIRVDNSSMRWRIGVESAPHADRTLIVTASPSINFGDITVIFDTPIDILPFPLNEVDDWIITTILNSLRPSLNSAAESLAKIRFFMIDEVRYGRNHFEFVKDYYLENYAVVLTARFGYRPG